LRRRSAEATISLNRGRSSAGEREILRLIEKIDLLVHKIFARDLRVTLPTRYCNAARTTGTSLAMSKTSCFLI
jgi:hypothetical protein